MVGCVCLTLGLSATAPATADQEASNVAHVVAGAYGRCYAKSVPQHLYDPEDGPRQQGRTEIYQVANSEDVLEQQYDWFSQRILIHCRPGQDTLVVRIGPWQRGHDPSNEHLALAFYRDGVETRRYSTLDIAGEDRAMAGALSAFKNISASVSHYEVFSSGPELVQVDQTWIVLATTVDGRRLEFDIESGALR